MYRCGGSNNAMVFSMPYDGESPVDCTLSLGTPATRLTGDYDRVNHERRSSANWSANFCWDILQPSPSQKAVHGGGNGGTTVAEPLLARRCANCDTTSTPLWRNGPRGPKSLCNACGIRFKKEERRANAAATATTNVGDTTETQHYQQMMNMNANPWVHHTQATHKLPSCYSPAASKVNEFRFIDDVDDRDSPFLSWRLNVTDGPGLVHGFTR
ncbi:putative transcription factor C2C2-GATA family [Helianthus annuus]|nr:putative transcription factor C2C2-GATA family [Helianthus annuus]KAJ0873586.1 putative transcription factor C2C2-GATA family [Helianthus annuus]